MNVRVAVRLRPFSDRELDLDPEQRCLVSMQGTTTTLHHPSFESRLDKHFEFDASLWSHSGFQEQADGYLAPEDKLYVDQARLFSSLGQGVLDNALEGYHSCLFAYGQTGSGKSYSMVGYGANPGIVPVTCQ